MLVANIKKRKATKTSEKTRIIISTTALISRPGASQDRGTLAHLR